MLRKERGNGTQVPLGGEALRFKSPAATFSFPPIVRLEFRRPPCSSLTVIPAEAKRSCRNPLVAATINDRLVGRST